ncbi:unnamed protein product [Durusdinium trenchii]|uniref:Uncharacterized protein n=2 Tax=Durusdinium trenchii TaxID=1381693 RepID=A0ABP0P7E3_9DINO
MRAFACLLAFSLATPFLAKLQEERSPLCEQGECDEVQLLQAEKLQQLRASTGAPSSMASAALEVVWQVLTSAAGWWMQRHDLGARVDLRPMQRQFPYVPAEGRQFWMYATATTCPVEVLEQWPKGFDNPDCEKFAPGENKVSVFVDSTRPSIQALKWLGKVIPLLEEAKWYQGLIKGLERWTVGNHKGFVATDDTLKAIIVSVSGTGMVTNLGFFADVLADTNANSLYGLECPILQIQKKLKFVPYIKKLPGLYHRGFCWFYNMMVLYTSYQTDLITAVKANPSYDVIFAGHSLGGAAITLAAADYLHRIRPELTKKGSSVVDYIEAAVCDDCAFPESSSIPSGVPATGHVLLYTYGSPRAGSPSSADYLHARLDASYRVTRNGDPVPLLMMCQRQESDRQACTPAEENPYHVGQEVYYPHENGTHYMCNGLGEDPKCADSRSIEHGYTFEEFAYGFGNIHTAYYGMGPWAYLPPTQRWCCSD